MTPEQKAKAYDEALEKAKQIIVEYDYDEHNNVFMEIFPELKESEDEKIRKEIINIFHSLADGRIPVPINFADIFTWLEKQGEQKSADEVEPRFHEGEWITNGDYTWKIVEVKPLVYILQSQDGNIVDDTIFHVNEQFHSFTIKDAKDGDVLSSDNSIFIFQEEYIAKKPIAYCGLMNGRFIEGKDACWTNEKYYPATKEQRDLLFQKIKEAGYEWDDEKKELKKIEADKLTDFEGALFTAFSDGWQQYLSGEEVNVAQWTKEHSAELLEVAKQNFTAWSEEDDNMIDTMEGWLDTLCEYLKDSSSECIPNVESCINWLKSLKQRIGGEV